MRFVIRLCCRLGLIVFQYGRPGFYRFLGGRKLTNLESYYVEHKWIRLEMKKMRKNGNHHA